MLTADITLTTTVSTSSSVQGLKGARSRRWDGEFRYSATRAMSSSDNFGGTSLADGSVMAVLDLLLVIIRAYDPHATARGIASQSMFPTAPRQVFIVKLGSIA